MTTESLTVESLIVSQEGSYIKRVILSYMPILGDHAGCSPFTVMARTWFSIHEIPKQVRMTVLGEGRISIRKGCMIGNALEWYGFALYGTPSGLRK